MNYKECPWGRLNHEVKCILYFSEIPGSYYEMSSFPETKVEKWVNRSKAKFFAQYPLLTVLLTVLVLLVFDDSLYSSLVTSHQNILPNIQTSEFWKICILEIIVGFIKCVFKQWMLICYFMGVLIMGMENVWDS